MGAEYMETYVGWRQEDDKVSRHPKERGPGSGNEKVLSKVSGRWGCLTITLGPAKLCAPPCSRKSSPPPPPTLLGLSQAPASLLLQDGSLLCS